MVDYTDLIKHFGLLGVLILFAWRAAPVVWAEATKWSERGLKFFDKLETTQDAIVGKHHEHKQQSERHEDLSWRIYDETKGNGERLDRIIERMGMSASGPNRARRRKQQGAPNDPAAPASGASPASSSTSPPASSTPPSSS